MRHIGENYFRRLESEFAELIDHVDREIADFLQVVDVQEIATFNHGYLQYGSDKFYHFVEMEKRRFFHALNLILKRRSKGTVVDLGCFVPYLPVALAHLGFTVKIVDKYSLFGAGVRKGIHALASRCAIEVIDLDILNESFDRLGTHDFVLLMAVVEHLNGTPRHLMQKIRAILCPSGFVIFEVPNIAELRKRLRFLLGNSPLPSYTSYFKSSYPFMGHNREMTVDEVRYLLNETGFEIEELYCYDYNSERNISLTSAAVGILKKVLPLKNMDASIMAAARLK